MGNVMMRKLVAALACRNQGTRLYGKPIQNLDIEKGITILDNILDCLNSIEEIDEVILGISEGDENLVFRTEAEKRGLRYVIGSEQDVLKRLIDCGKLGEATDIFRVTSESPFVSFAKVKALWRQYCDEGLDALFLDNIVDGCGFEIISQSALERSHNEGESRHRSELCTLFIRENLEKFKVAKVEAEPEFYRTDLRLTVDNPEDLVICRAIYKFFQEQAPRINLRDIITFLDKNPELISLTAPFTEVGYQTMYVWGNGQEINGGANHE